MNTLRIVSGVLLLILATCTFIDFNNRPKDFWLKVGLWCCYVVMAIILISGVPLIREDVSKDKTTE